MIWYLTLVIMTGNPSTTVIQYGHRDSCINAGEAFLYQISALPAEPKVTGIYTCTSALK